MTGNGTPGSASVEVFDRDGKHAIDARIWFPGVVEVLLVDAVPLDGGGVLASGDASTEEGFVGDVMTVDPAAVLAELDRPNAGQVPTSGLLTSGAVNRVAFEFNADRQAKERLDARRRGPGAHDRQGETLAA